ncbi:MULTISPECIES: hypothetical protein [Weeksella]|uniref:Lipoprotein n=1 Tax=Weeksella virosa (strain ATCC 43766 / DSM 16922 / JCM 21250 / CCUG 30538 / CDC 9751 / IAM 14551 / NBRC 16016 / NCTC 11634 / CL345/78) TaxID=865938 RepID=F0NZY1_WEEVC|nr:MULTISPECIES: hypothetical protein [Weeksella]ADX68405.1 hypothetical protein Weevi_1713 [Weeksella virosa DSM 16922]MDK7375540.1 hypothetical protein [Weeksella virosa]MDK7674629.1 hypothetical protein [Weeksella virosa]OFM84323.1 hypothetical protein HMPREF2660_09045 [Weeksella sp. HMSC059D05]SUP54737.1 Uncharacterised protein [Weeksella virosa]
MIKKFFFALAAYVSVYSVTSCKKDDDNKDELDVYVDIPLEQRNALDDEAIQQYLAKYYFHPTNGKLTAKDTIVGTNPTTGINDDEYPTLDNFAQRDEKGIWYAINPNVQAEGNSITSNKNDSILISYDNYIFRATDNKNYKYKFGQVRLFSSTTERGVPVYDPVFYHVNLTDEQIKSGFKEEYYVLENFVEGLKHFKATNRSSSDLYHMQGVIILPSRLAYARRKVWDGNYLNDQIYRDYSFVFSFELNKIIPRKK